MSLHQFTAILAQSHIQIIELNSSHFFGNAVNQIDKVKIANEFFSIKKDEFVTFCSANLFTMTIIKNKKLHFHSDRVNFCFKSPVLWAYLNI